MHVSNAFALSKWLTEKKVEIETNRPSQKDLAAQASAELGFKITTPNLKACARHAGVELVQRKTTVAADELRNLTLDIIQAGSFTPEYVAEVLADETMPEWIQDAFRSAEQQA